MTGSRDLIKGEYLIGTVDIGETTELDLFGNETGKRSASKTKKLKQSSSANAE